MTIQRIGSRASQKAPAEHFTGSVTVGPNEKHWHAAAPTTAMTHIAIQEALDGKAVEWLEKVTDEQYQSNERRAP